MGDTDFTAWDVAGAVLILLAAPAVLYLGVTAALYRRRFGSPRDATHAGIILGLIGFLLGAAVLSATMLAEPWSKVSPAFYVAAGLVAFYGLVQLGKGLANKG